MVGNYLQCFCTFNQDSWDKLLKTGEFAYISAKIESLNMSPFELDLGWLLRSLLAMPDKQSEDNIQTVTNFRNRLEELF